VLLFWQLLFQQLGFFLRAPLNVIVLIVIVLAVIVPAIVPEIFAVVSFCDLLRV